MTQMRNELSALSNGICSGKGLKRSMRALVPILIASGLTAAAIPLPMVCELNSEEVPSIQIQLKERTTGALQGILLQKGRNLGTFQTGQSNRYGNVWWSFHDQHDKGDGISVLFRDKQLWNPYGRKVRPAETNRVLFVGLASHLRHWDEPKQKDTFRGNRDLLKAAAGFWAISDQCLGGRMMRG